MTAAAERQVSERGYSWSAQAEVIALGAGGRSKSFAAWCMIMECRASIERHRHREDWTPEASDRVNGQIEARIDIHGEPHPIFVRAWLLEQVDTYQFLSRKAPDEVRRAHADGWLDALRALWRRYVPEEGRTNA